MLLSRRLCVLLGAACVGCVGPTPIPEVVVVRNAINGANYWGSTEYFVRRNGAESLCDKLIETYGGIANACVVIEPVVNLLISACTWCVSRKMSLEMSRSQLARSMCDRAATRMIVKTKKPPS